MNENSAQTHCPYLGLADDRGMYCLFPTTFHRCYRGNRGKSVDAGRQQRLCLSPGYTDCSTYTTTGLAWGRKRRSILYSSLVACVLVGALVLFAQAAGNAGGVPLASSPADPTSSPTSVMSLGRAPVDSAPARTTTPTPDARPSQTSTPVVEATHTATAASSPSATPPPATSTPTPGPAPVPDAAPPATATPSPTPRRIHVVAAGETLTSIAVRYQTSIDAIMRVNGLTNRNFVFSGQRLIIP